MLEKEDIKESYKTSTIEPTTNYDPLRKTVRREPISIANTFGILTTDSDDDTDDSDIDTTTRPRPKKDKKNLNKRQRKRQRLATTIATIHAEEVEDGDNEDVDSYNQDEITWDEAV